MASEHPPVSRSSRRLLGALLLPLLLALLVGTAVALPPARSDRRLPGDPVAARLVSVAVVPCPDTVPEAGIECLRVGATLGGGRRVALRPIPVDEVARDAVRPGADVVLRRTADGDLASYELGGPDRGRPLALLALVVVLLVVVVLGRHGLRLLAVLAGVALVTFGIAVPALDAGDEPGVVAAVTGGWTVVLVTLLRPRPVARHVAAAVAALAALALASLAVAAAVAPLRLDGFATDEGAAHLLVLGVVVGAAAAATEVALRQVDHTWHLRDLDPSAGWWSVAGRGLRRGRRDAAAGATVLVVAVVGATLPGLALLAGPDPRRDLLVNGVALEMTRVLAALVVVLLAVPAAAAVAAAIAVRERRAAPASDPRAFRTRQEWDLWRD